MTQTPVIADIKPLRIMSDGTIVDEDTPEDVHFYSGWEPTTEAVAKDIEESLGVAQRIQADKGQCWFNARKAIRRLNEYAEANYVEGWAVTSHGLAIEHGWVVRDDKIVDPTLPDELV